MYDSISSNMTEKNLILWLNFKFNVLNFICFRIWIFRNGLGKIFKYILLENWLEISNSVREASKFRPEKGKLGPNLGDSATSRIWSTGASRPGNGREFRTLGAGNAAGKASSADTGGSRALSSIFRDPDSIIRFRNRFVYTRGAFFNTPRSREIRIL